MREMGICILCCCLMKEKKNEFERVQKVASEILKICADAGGTISGEHGIGVEKLKEMSFIFSESDLEAMRQVKRAFDPDGILNPGKLIPESIKTP